MHTLEARIEAAARGSGGVTFVAGERHERVPWSDIHAGARVRAGALVARGIGPGAHVGILGPTSREHVTLIQAVWRAGATVVVRHQESGVFRQATSGADGSYFLAGVNPGVYEMSVEMDGFKRYSRRDLKLEIGKTATVDARLEVGGITEELTITAEAPIVDITSKEVGGNITERELTDLPSINRNFIGFIGLAANTVGVDSREGSPDPRRQVYPVGIN